MHFKFSLICFQECWHSDNDDKSHLQIDGYDCITQGKTCGNKGGLVMYINNCFNYNNNNNHLLKINEKHIVGEFFDMLISNSFCPHITLPTRFSNNNGTLIDNLFCKIDKYAKQPKSGIQTKQFSDHQPCFTFLNNVQLKDKPST